MNRLFALTLDLEAAVSGVLEPSYSIFDQRERIAAFLDDLQNRGVPLTVFVVGDLLDRFPEMIELFRSRGCEFHCHSHTHDPQAPDSAEEIAACRKAFERFFGYTPQGYRAPQGKISREGLGHLEAQGFAFDSSVFPSYYPNPFRYLFRRRHPHMLPDSRILEIPFTAISPLRVTLSISWIKLLGWATYHHLLRVSDHPREVVFGTHLHDFFLGEEHMQRLPRFWTLIYSRNRGLGLDWLYLALDFFKLRGYEFVYMSEIYNRYHPKEDERP